MSVASAFGNVMLPETYLKIVLNKPVNRSTGLSGQYAAEHYSANVIYQFEVGISPGYSYSENRNDILDIEQGMKDHTQFQYTLNLSGFTAYQGDVTDLANVTHTSSVHGESTVYVNTTAVTGSPSGNLVRAGDWVRVGNKFAQASEDVTYSSSSNIAIPLSRPNIDTGSVSLVANAPFFNVKFAEYNPYTIQPYDRLQYKNPSVKLIEVI
tara:strand:+ start:811 stop:1440 length:630 start_codon:yes stop_codon:yes gene_type:complete